MEEALNRKILNVLKKYGIEELNEVQKKAIPLIKAGKNVLIIAPTGSGKTEAAVLPILERIYETRPAGVYSIYITPLRALNRDLLQRLKNYCEELKISVEVRHSDTSPSQRSKMVLNPVEFLITTPETLNIMFSGRRLRNILKNVRVVIIDELHELVDNERGYQLTLILERLRNLSGNFQRIGLSATISNEVEVAKFIAGGNDIEILNLRLSKEYEYRVVAGDLQSHSSDGSELNSNYYRAIEIIIKEIGSSNSTLVFTNTRRVAENLGYELRMRGIDYVEVYHASMSREARINIEERFREGKTKALICTSSMELGIDIGRIDKVVQFNSPKQVSRLIQRVGRASHTIDKVSKGIIVGYCGDELEEAMNIVILASRGVIEKPRIRKRSLCVLTNQIVGEVWCSRGASVMDLYATFTRSYVFRDMSFEDFKKLVEFLSSIDLIRFDGQYLFPTKKTMKYFYDNISMIPDEKSYRVVELTGSCIGEIDEIFAKELDVGSMFVLGGKTWRVVNFNDNKVIVEMIEYHPSDPPFWVGEEIPVEYEVALEVGRNRRKRRIENFVNDAAKREIEEWRNISLFDDMTISYYVGNGEVLLLGCFGTRLALTLALILSALLGNKYRIIKYIYKPYSVYLKLGSEIKPSLEEILDPLLREDQLEEILKIVCKNYPVFQHTFVYVAKKFGVLEKGAEIGTTTIHRLIEFYKETPLYLEAVNKFLHDCVDLDSARNISRKIRNNEIKFVELAKIDRLRQYLSVDERNKNIPITQSILERVMNRLKQEEMSQICLSCGHIWHTQAKDAKRECSCCRSTFVSIAPKYREADIKTIREIIKSNRKISEKEKKIVDEMRDMAALLREHGYRAALCIAGRGVGVSIAKKILQIPVKDDFELVRRILEREVEYARTRKYWNIR